MKKISLKKSFILSLLFLSACSIFNTSGSNIENSQGNNPNNNAQVTQSAQVQDNLNNVLQNNGSFSTLNISDIEILWLIPNEPTEGFILSYGFSENSLDNKIKLMSNELQEVADPVYNKVYRYILKNIPRDKIVYLQLTAFNGNNFSLPSKIFTLRAN